MERLYLESELFDEVGISPLEPPRRQHRNGRVPQVAFWYCAVIPYKWLVKVDDCICWIVIVVIVVSDCSGVSTPNHSYKSEVQLWPMHGPSHLGKSESVEFRPVAVTLAVNPSI
jgi:hypothetical protein